NDLKANNICVHDTCKGIKCVVIDFGMASKICSSPLYQKAKAAEKCKRCTWMAPEVLKALPSTFTSDTYSLASMFDKLAGKCRVNLPHDVKQWINKGLSVEPNRRQELSKLNQIIKSVLDNKRT
ncbi:hypothetical protein OTU49_013556, partial [Cherax quadricarinatus]